MDWTIAERFLSEIEKEYTRDSLRKAAYWRNVYPLKVRYDWGERSEDLLKSILKLNEDLSSFR